MAIESHMNDPVLRTLAELNAHVERTSAERRAARQQATDNVMAQARQRQANQEQADATKLAVGMTGREGQDYLRAKQGEGAGRAASEASMMAGKRDSDGIRQGGIGADDEGLEPGDLDALNEQEEAGSFGEDVGNRMSGQAVSDAALQQRKDAYRQSEFEPFAGTDAQRGQARLSQAANSAREGVNQADAMAKVREMMSNGYTLQNSPQAPAAPTSMAPMTPQKAAMLAALDAAKTSPYGGMPGSGPAAAQLDAAVAPQLAQLAAAPSPSYPMPQAPQMGGPAAPMDPGFAAYLAQLRPPGR